MSTRSSKSGKNRKYLYLIAVIAVIGLLIAFGYSALSGEDGDQNQQKETVGNASGNAVETEEITAEEPKDVFPCELEDGKLKVTSFFQFTGSNPDCNGEEGENIASINLVNQSEKHLALARLTAVLSDGTEIHFEVSDIPAGKSVMTFSTENTDYELSNPCKEIICTMAEFENDSVVMEDKVSVTVQETEVVLTNTSEKELSDLTVYCHCLLDTDYFGGLTYQYPVDTIPAGESVTLQAADCYLGEAAVVRISDN